MIIIDCVYTQNLLVNLEVNNMNSKEKELHEHQKNRININKGEVTFVSKEELEKMGIKFFDSKVTEKED